MDGLSFRRVAGGSVIDCPPVFSENGDILFTIVTKVDLTALSTYCADRWVGSVSAYSTKTAECIYELELPSKVVNIERMPGSSTMMVGCTEAGQIFTWKSKSSKIETATEMFPELSVSVKTFNIVPFEDNYFALITWTCVGGTVIQMDMFDLNGNNQQWKLIQLEEGEHKISVSRNDNKIIAAIQNHKLFVTKLVRGGDSKKSSIFTNAGRERFTVVACHPVEQTVAVGDVTGKIFIYRSLFKRSNNPPTTLFHWHHNGVNAIAFTSSGSIFYSGGTERVLLAWNYRDDGKNLRPQLNGAIVQIAVSPDNQQIAASTDDNGIVIVNTQLNPIKLIQNFVRVADEKTPWPLFPLGLNVDPCTGYIVMNGRIGEVQFYSPYDRTFFNLDVTEENRLSLESGKILYNTRITHVACNVDWTVIAECLDDLTRFPEVRLKFYLFDVTQKKFVLSTQIETPHENGVTALAFSSTQRVDNLLCASSGLDGTVKIWGLVENDDYIESPDSENGNRATTTRKYWVCQTKTTYKDLPVSSLAFMSDGSALGVGFGNTLCVYDAETLQLRAALSAPSGLDGSTNKVIVSNPKPLSNSQLMKVQKLAQRGEEIVRNFLENDDDQLINDLIKETEKLPQQNQNSQTADDVDKKKLFQKLLAHNELNFYQYLELFQKMGIRIKVPDDSEHEFRRYVIMTMSVAVKEDHLKEQCAKLGPNKKFLGHWMLQNYLTRRREAAANGFHWENVIFGDDTLNSSRTSNGIESMEWENDQPSSTTADPVRNVSNIQRVLFGTGDSQLLAIVCTENRLLIWNLLTLRLQSSWKLTLRNISVDPSTGLVAINTFSDELYVLHPSKQYVLYQRKNMPKIHGMVWLPRREPRKSSLDVDWQSVSQLFFLSRDQELLYLVPDNDEDLFADRGVTLKQVDQFEPQTSFGVMVARQGTNDAASSAGQRNMAGGLIGEPTKMSVRELTDLQTHTMAPLRLLCYKFLTSVLTRQVVQSVDPSKSQNEDDDVDMEYDSETEESGQLNGGTIPERLDSTVNVISQEDTERRNAVFNRLYNEKPKHNFTFMSPMVG